MKMEDISLGAIF